MSDVTSIPQQLSSDDDLYPTRDGQPMAETEFHAEEMTELRLMLRRHFEPQADRVYVGSNLFIYYEQGNPRAVFSPDVFAVRGAPQRLRDTYKLWQDGPTPCFVIEVSSKSTRLEDKGNKKATCEMLGVTEYFLYDPRAEYLLPPLQGFRLFADGYRPIDMDDSGALRAQTLDLSLCLGEHGLIEVRDTETGERLRRTRELQQRAEQEKARADREAQRADRERARAEAAERRLAELERGRG